MNDITGSVVIDSLAYYEGNDIDLMSYFSPDRRHFQASIYFSFRWDLINTIDANIKRELNEQN